MWPVTRRTAASTWSAPRRTSAASACQLRLCSASERRFVLRVSRRERRLLCQRRPLDRRRWASVLVLEAPRQCRKLRLDAGPARGPGAQQLGWDSGDLTDLAPALTGITALGEPHADPLDQQGFQPGVVVLGRGDLVPVQRPSVQRQPPPLRGADLVADRDVRVQVGVAGARIAVGERRCDEAGGVDLGDAVGSAPGVGGVLLQPRDRVPHRLVVARGDGRGQLARRDRPQRRHALHR